MPPLHLWYERLTRVGLRLLAVLGLLLVVVTLTPLDNWWARMLAGRSYTDTGDVLVVLSGSEFGDGTMGWNSYLRAYYAGLSFRAGGFKEVVITGGSEGSSSVPVSIAMSQFLTYQGIPAKVIHLETLSHSTRENALYCRAILDALPGRKVLLTSDYHMFRARRTFAKLGMTALPQPVPDVFKRTGRWYGRWPAFLDLLVETCKIGYYWVRGWI